MLCVDPLHGTLVHTKLIPEGSTFRTEDVEIAVKTTDKWFRPVAIADGPDGAAYVSDWYDSQVAHIYAHVGRLDKDHGRLYRLAPSDAPVASAAWDGKLATATHEASVHALVAKLKHPLRWQRWHARQLLARHPQKHIALEPLKQMLASGDRDGLEALWAIHACGWLADSMLASSASASELVQPATLLTHPNPHVRSWTIRLVADDHDVDATTLAGLLKLAGTESDPIVLSQLACSARRLPTDKALQVCAEMLDRDLPVDDPHLPLLIWWAVEKHADQIDAVEHALAERPSLYQHAMFQQHIAPRLVERAGMVGGERPMAMLAKVFATIERLPAATRSAAAKACVAGFERAFAGRSLAGVPDSVLDAMARLGEPSLALRLRRGDASAQEQAAKLVADPKADLPARLQVARILGEVPGPAGMQALLSVCCDQKADLQLRLAAASSLAAYDDPAIADRVLEHWHEWPADLRSSAGAMLVAKPSGAARWLDALDAVRVKASDLPLEVVRMLRLHDDPKLLARIDRYYPPIGKVDLPTAQKRAGELSQLIFAGQGDPYRGKRLYSESCGRCHVLFDQGGLVGPNLTGYQRDQLTPLLINVLAPSLEVREGFQAMAVLTTDGKLITGFVERESPSQLVMRSIDGQTHIIDREEIESLKPQAASLMPEGLLDNLTPEQLCDLFAYLRSSQPLSDGT
jgi:putative heme-binding domain-containing protein